MSMYRVAVLVSGGGSNLQALLDARAGGELAADVAVVVSDRGDTQGLQRALSAGVPAVYLPLARPPGAQARAEARAAWELQLADLLNLFAPDLVVLSGFMRVLSARFLARCTAPAINQHPALLPDGGGQTVTTSGGLTIPALRGAHVVADVLRLGLPITGCSIHRVTPVVDDGPILARVEVPVVAGDDEASLHERIKRVEQRLIVEVVARLAAERP
jgi:phosphoribosylglycinamide formyltransferase-1